MRFPLDPAIRAQILNGRNSYHTGGRQFGRPRENGKRAHAGCDLIAPVGTPIYAVADGRIIEYDHFYRQTYFIEVDHHDFIVRYGEVQPPWEKAQGFQKPPPQSQCRGLAVKFNKKEGGTPVKRGDVIGWVGQLREVKKNGSVKIGGHMIHFEMYKKTATGDLTQPSNKIYDYVPNKTYKRRRDILDPTHFLDESQNN